MEEDIHAKKLKKKPIVRLTGRTPIVCYKNYIGTKTT